ncbi:MULTISPECIES: hypothetical protein [Pseudoalteromonas]|uniref:hypothetical protein n=1 Tax=Pseudoalteromonas TaxID=53246 RepID=UPI000BBBFA1A|nr:MULTISPECIES: hypothetical protein [Pseudoalteromonas]MDC9499699.1 hypothetical protein [Pseudoalteromonas sp. Angola-20]MDC9519336.1 hypothetical protein [Pseudoalteromonas sp. Angola-22]MDC9535755.1 hypothetical protein [Pseudoalteromonas sp. Angola-9]
MFEVIESVLQSKIFKFFICILLGVYVCFMIITPINNGWQSAITTWKEWQTFNAAIIAFLSTLLIVHSTKISERKNMLRKRNATKAFMPTALAELCDYMKSLIQLLEKLHQGNEAFELKVKPNIPAQAFIRIEKFIEESVHQDQKLVEHLIIVINSIQIFDSRLTALLTEKHSVSKQERALYQIDQFILLHALISGMFDYTRNNVDSYNIEKLDKNRFNIKDCTLFMKEDLMNEYANKNINFDLFVK